MLRNYDLSLFYSMVFSTNISTIYIFPVSFDLVSEKSFCIWNINKEFIFSSWQHYTLKVLGNNAVESIKQNHFTPFPLVYVQITIYPGIWTRCTKVEPGTRVTLARWFSKNFVHKPDILNAFNVHWCPYLFALLRSEKIIQILKHKNPNTWFSFLSWRVIFAISN